jgi:hypothetical protein
MVFTAKRAEAISQGNMTIGPGLVFEGNFYVVAGYAFVPQAGRNRIISVNRLA